jgi:integrase
MNTAVTMQSYAEQFLDERRGLGFASRSMGYALASFARYSSRTITRARRLKVLRPFARWMQQFEPGTEVPDDTVFGSVDQRLTPHIYTEREIADLLVAARHLCPLLRGVIYQTLFSLLAATGLRVSEALHLFDVDVDLKSGLLTVRRTKFAKSRQVPVHPSTLDALRQYRLRRDPWVASTDATPFFVGTRGRRQGCALSLRQVDRVLCSLHNQ